MRDDYGLNIWANGDFIIDKGRICLNTPSKPALQDMVEQIRSTGLRGPILLRFPHLIAKQLDELYSSFKSARKEFNYTGAFKAVYPLKVNQYPAFVQNIVEIGTKHGYGLEAGSKAELLIAMAYNAKKAPITVNGFKDKELINLGFIAAEMGHDVTITIEGLGELQTIIETASSRFKPKPNIGLRIRLHSSGSGIWAKSGGINSKFGLTSTELIEAVNLLKKHGLIEQFSMIHFHIGSQINDIHPLKKALLEAGNIYAELRKMGAKNLRAINLGGGLAIEYSQFKDCHTKNYTLKEYANDVVFLLQSIASQKGEVEPDIFVESGRFVAASHAVLTAPVLELFSQEYSEKKLALKKQNPPLIAELYDLYNHIKPSNAIEYLHDATSHLDSVLTLFELGYVDLSDRSNAEILTHLIVKKTICLLGSDAEYADLRRIQNDIQERYLVNFSIFQSLPDFWGLKQHFPIAPLKYLDKRPTLSASIWDITCDSDGEIGFDSQNNPLFLHDVDIEEEPYFLGFFLVGAYQEVLGMRHNLFTHPSEAVIEPTKDGFIIKELIESQSIMDILYDLDYDIDEIKSSLNKQIEGSKLVNEKAKKQILGELYLFLNANGYLKTVQ